MKKNSAVLLLAIVSGSGFAAGTPSPTPENACNFLSAMPFINTPSKYKPYYTGSNDFTCGTPYFEIVTPAGDTTLNNNISYYASGTEVKINKLTLMLNMNNRNPDAVKIANGYYVNGSFEILKKMFPESPGEIADITSAITDGKEGDWSVEGWKVSSVKKTWPTGKGYELSFILTAI